MHSTDRDRAIILGGGIAGLTTARVLSDHFAEVAIIDRDALGPDAGARRGTPHGTSTACRRGAWRCWRGSFRA